MELPVDLTQTLKKGALNLLTQAILEGRLKPGERVNESLLARQLHISRAPIREALHQLQEQGLIVNVPWRGMFVVSLSKEDIQKINSLRIILEAEALRLARIHLTPSGEEKLAQLADAIESSRATPQATGFDFQFHRTIWRLGGNEYLERVLTSLVGPLYAQFQLRASLDHERIVVDSHRPLLDFVQGKSSQSAEEAMIKHLSIAYSDPARFSSLARKARKRSGTRARVYHHALKEADFRTS